MGADRDRTISCHGMEPAGGSRVDLVDRFERESSGILLIALPPRCISRL